MVHTKELGMTFRRWCYEKWMDHKDELESYGQGLPYSSEKYFNMYKYWLKREFKHYQGQQ